MSSKREQQKIIMADHYNMLEYGILDVNSDSENRNLHNLVDSMATERSVCIKVRNNSSRSEPSLSSTTFHLAFFVIHRTRSDTDVMSSEALVRSFTCRSITRSKDLHLPTKQRPWTRECPYPIRNSSCTFLIERAVRVYFGRRFLPMAMAHRHRQ
ncbi:hypothetical protein TIFTF001_003715 [Ficus carica]|uniref:Uncharacterized protein n=1 Tax=Ficus carica TaxID=3494 RepID=A0AA87ZGZ1_FICCA|nr:hypothetical protein TIFTF001_003715 [Ficus carica]